MVPLYRDEAVVLRTHKLGEADRIVTMLSRQHGKIRAVAKGVRRTASKFGARLEPFMVADVQCYEGRSLDIITQAESLGSYGAEITGDYGSYTAASVMVETADKLNKMSQQVGIATDTLSALQSQAALSDVGFDQFGTAMERLARSATAAAGGAQQQAAAYQAMGVSVTNAAGQMRPMSAILQDVATKMASYKDGAAKTALAQELFGRSGAQLIPLLNELGTAGFDEVRRHAEEYNQVIGPEQARLSEQFHDNMTRMQQAVSGFANAVVGQLLPTLVNYTNQMADAAKTNDRYAESATSVAGAVKVISFSLQALWEASKITTDLTYGVVKASAEAGKALVNEGVGAAAGKFKALGAEIGGSVADLKKGFDSLFGTFANVSSGVSTTAGAMQHAQAPIVKMGSAAADAGKQLRELDAAMDRLDSDLDKLSAKMAGPYVQAQEAYNLTVRQLQNDAEAAAIAGGNVTEIIHKWQEAETLAGAALGQTLAQIREEHDLFRQQETDYKNLMQVLQVEPQYRDVARAALQKYDDLMKSHYDFYGNYIQDENDLRDALDKQLPIYEQGQRHIQDVTQAEKLNQDVTHDWINIWQQAGDQLASTFASILVNGGSLFQALTNLAKQTVSQIIAYFAKLAVINPILNAIFGSAITGGAGLLPTLASAGVSAAGGGGGGAGGIMSGAQGFFSRLTGGGGR